MPMFKVYLGNLDAKVTADSLKPMFEPFGDVEEIVIATDQDGKSRGFAIILFRDPLKGQLAIETLANRKINGRTVVINEAVKKGKKTQPAARMPRNTPLGPRAFPRVGGFNRGPGAARGASSGGSRFIRNPRRLFNQPMGTGAPGGLPPGAASGGAAPAGAAPGGLAPGGEAPSSPVQGTTPAAARPVPPAAPKPVASAPPASTPARAPARAPAPAPTPAPAPAPEAPAKARAVKKSMPPSPPAGA